MTNANRRKGDQYERDVVAFAREHGFPHAERCYGGGRPDDVGDLELIPGMVVSCKAEKRIDLSEFLDEAVVQAGRSGAKYAVVVIKRRAQSDVGESYVVQTLEQFCEREGDLIGVPDYSVDTCPPGLHTRLVRRPLEQFLEREADE